MAQSIPGLADPTTDISPVVGRILMHLCEGDCHTFGDILEWCETRGDCCHAVVCPSCGAQFVIDEDELTELQRWTAVHGSLHVCGIRLDD